ncbi:hypothetical protein BX070DRAFT_253645 [Coemansia spiralis]|nr:hypothetical protein BX070DRAFT_253645 [Coemansia spiralis]
MSATPAASGNSGSNTGTSISGINVGSSSSSAGSGHAAKRMRLERPAWRSSGDILPLRKYTPTPSNGTAPLHSTHDYGYADFYPAKDTDSENQLTERTIRHGYVDIPRVENEHMSGHEIVFDRLQDQRVFQGLQSFAANTAQRQWARGCITGSDFPKLPNRSVRSDDRRDEWLRSLANPRMPLSILANSMPFGLRGERLLDALRQNQVPLQRAMWAIRLTGVYEMFGMQTRAPDHTNLKALEKQFTGQWSKQFTQFIEHTLNSAPTNANSSSSNNNSGTIPQADSMSPAAASSTAATPAATPHRTPSATSASSPMSPALWARNWEFCLSLLHAQYNQGLLDQRYFVSWLVSQFRQTSVDKCMLILPLIKDYTSEIGKSRTPLRKLISAVTHRLSNLASHPSLQLFNIQLGKYLLSLFTTFPDAFVEPSTWHTYKSALGSAYNSISLADKEQSGIAPSLYTSVLKQVDSRNSKFDCLSAVQDQHSVKDVPVLDSRLTALHILSSLNSDSNMSSAYAKLFATTSDSEVALQSQSLSAAYTIRLICYWAVEDQLLPAVSQFRFLAASRLCKMYLDGQTASDNSDPAKVATAIAPPSSKIQNAIVGFLDIFDLPSACFVRKNTVWRVCSLLERLADSGCFSISQYLQLLTARGDFFGSNLNSTRSQRHLEYAVGIPARTTEDEAQRQMALGDWQSCSPTAKSISSQQNSSQAAVAAKLKDEISALLPFLVAYTCGTPFRAKNNDKAPTIDLEIVRWWMASGSDTKDVSETSLLDQQILPKASQFTQCKLLSPIAHDACTKDWISPLFDHVADERLLNRAISPAFLDTLNTYSRAVVDVVVNQRLMPIIYDYVVKDIKVGEDNWRVITQPGTSLLNRRQAAVVVRILIESRYFGQLLDFLIWILGHTRVLQVAALAHHTLRRFTHTWRLLGRFKHAIFEVEKAYKSNAIGSELFDFEYYRTAAYWNNVDNEECKQEAKILFDAISSDYEFFVNTHSQPLLQSGHASGHTNASKEILQLAQQVVRGRMRETIGSTADEIDWAILPCFQKLTRCALSATQRSEYAGSPAGTQHELPNSPNVTSSARLPRLQSMLAYIISDVTQAALVAGKSLPLAPEGTADRAKDVALLRCFVDLCALFIRWFAINAGLAKSPEYIGPLLLNSISTTIGSWTIGKNSTSVPGTSSSVVSPLYSGKDIEVGIHISSIWINSILSFGCLRVDELIPWLIEKCHEEATQKNIAQYTCLAGIIYALGMPASYLREKQAEACDGSGDARMDTTNPEPSRLRRRSRSGNDSKIYDDKDNGGVSDLYSKVADIRYQYELLDIGSCWRMALEANKVLRIQAIELVFISASASGRLRLIGASQLAAILIQTTAALAQSAWIQASVDCIPSSIQGNNQQTQESTQRYYSMLEIYRANIEKQIKDPSTALPVKRAMLRALMVLCEGVDPEDEGFSAMTTAEVAHRLCETIRRFWNGPAIKGKSTASVSKLATILSSLLLFSSTALRESEATTDAFAVAAGAGLMSNTGMAASRSGVDSNATGQDTESASRALGDGSDQMQFVANVTECLALYIKDTIVGVESNGDGRITEPASSFSHRCVALAEALSTLSPETLLRFVETFSGTLFNLDVARFKASIDNPENSSKGGSHQSQLQPQEPPSSSLDRRVATIMGCAYPTDVSSLLDVPLVRSNTADSDEMDVDAATPVAPAANVDISLANELFMRRSALAKLTQQLTSKLCESVEVGTSNAAQSQSQQHQGLNSGISHDSNKALIPGSLQATLRDFASGILGQLQAIAVHVNPDISRLLSLTLATPSGKQTGKNARSPLQSAPYMDTDDTANDDAVPTVHQQRKQEKKTSDLAIGSTARLRLAISWRLQVSQSLCSLMREYPDEFGVGEWLTTLVALCLSPACQPPALPASTSLRQFYRSDNSSRSAGYGSKASNGPATCEFYQLLLDFAAVTSESITASMRKHTLELLRLVAPIARTAVCSPKYADMLGRLFPFDVSTSLTRDIQPLVSSLPSSALDNPWVWIESLEFVPLATLSSSSIPNGGLEGMTPFTLRGMLEHENTVLNEKSGGGGSKGNGSGIATGYLANLRFNTSSTSSSSYDKGNHGSGATRRSQVASVRRLQYLENPYFPTQPAFLFPLAETPIPWNLFGGKRRRMDSETRLIWRSQCEAAFERGDQ